MPEHPLVIEKRFSTSELEELAAFAAGATDFYTTGIREDKDGCWWAVIMKWKGAGVPAERIAEHGPFRTQTEAQAEVDAWGKKKAQIYTLLK